MKSLRRILGGCCAHAWLICAFALLLGAGSAQAQVATVSAFQPLSGKPGASVKITGANFTTAKTVTFFGVQAVFFIESDTVLYATVPDDALTGPIGVNNSIGGGASSTSFVVTPRITELTPDRGLSGRNVLIQGHNLANVTNVYFGDIATTFVPVSDTQISVTVPPEATNAPVKVMTTAGFTITTNNFLVTGEPIIRSFSPTVAIWGTIVIIDGGDFTGVTNVLFNGQPATGFAITAQNQVQAQIPANATSGPIKVQTPGGQATSVTNLITGPGPIVTEFSPAAGAVGTTVLITGAGFTGLNSVHFNNVAAISGAVTSDSQVQAVVPATATTGPIKLTKGTNSFTTSSNFIVGPAPKITSLNLNSGSVGSTVVIGGENLLHAGGANEVYIRFNGVQANYAMTGSGGSQVHATIPAGATSGFITASNSLGVSTSSESFTVVGTTPSIIDFSPKSGSPGSIVTLFGYGFNGASSVKLNNQSVNYTVTSISGTNQISTTLPADATTGSFSVTTSGGTGSSTNLFYVWPHIGSFGPVKATALSTLTLTGVNFTATMEVRIGEVVITPQLVNNTRVSFFVPESCVSAPITIKTPAGLMTTITNFAMLPKLDALVPDRGRAGDSVMIQGSGLFNVTSVKFNGIATTYTNNSVNLITATVPAGVTSGTVEVITGEGTAVSTMPFLVFPTVTDLSPRAGPHGTTVTLEGINLLDVTNVTFSFTPATFTVESGTRLTLTIPTAPSGNVRLFNPAGITVVNPGFVILPSMSTLLSANGKLVIQWPVDSPSFQLQHSETIAPPSWITYFGTVHTIGNLRTVTNTLEGSRFFRLKYTFPE